MREIAAYCRSACERQGSRSSVISQADAIRAHAVRHGFTIRREYVDRGVSGITLQRPALRQLLADCRAGKIGAVIVQDAERLARNEAQLFVILDEFRRSGVQLLFSTEHGRSAFQFRGRVWHAMCELGARREDQNS
jgi:site-specific DNA recombinase